uniref:Uncharacterized protein n=1 Tax=viral metagenome TaxID=1070528 RepID=A0A6C0I638_9ZZZZ
MSNAQWKDNSTTAVLYPTEVKTTVLNIDSTFRDNPQATSSTDFLIRLPRTYKNVITARLSSIEIPNTWYAFDERHGETSMLVNGKYVSIASGNYNPATLATMLETAINNVVVQPNLTVDFGLIPGKIKIDNSGVPFSMEFGSADTCQDSSGTVVRTSRNPYNNGLGYLLGFTGMLYRGGSSYTAEYVVNTLRDNYIYLQLPDLEDSLESHSYNGTIIKAFAKIIVNVDKNALIYDNGANMLTKQTQFAQPINISTFRVRLVNSYGKSIDLMSDWSFTLELQEVVSSKVYEAYRNNLIADC